MMTDRSDAPDFESLLRSDFRWPTIGDQPFTISDQWQNNSYIDPHGHGRLVMMITGYGRRSDSRACRPVAERRRRPRLPYHLQLSAVVELSLKYLIATYGHTVGIAAQWNTHDLGALWSTFVQVLDGYGHEDKEGTDAVVGTIITEFARVDPRSFSYRYPVDTKGKLVNLAHQEVDLHRLADVMSGLDGYFSGCDNLQSAGQ